MGFSTKQRLFAEVIKYFTKSGHRSFVVDVVTYLVAAKLNDCWHKVVPSFFKGFLWIMWP